jgi:hypothetical protein
VAWPALVAGCQLRLLPAVSLLPHPAVCSPQPAASHQPPVQPVSTPQAEASYLAALPSCSVVSPNPEEEDERPEAAA